MINLKEQKKKSVSAIRGHQPFVGSSAIHAIAHWVPDNIVTSADIEAKLGIHVELEKRMGLQEKRVCDDRYSVVDLAMQAADRLLSTGTFEGEPIPMDEIDLVIYFGVRREFEEPATAVLLQQRLDLSGAMAFDVSDACLGFSDAWCIADAMIATGRIRKALLISGEKISVLGEHALSAIKSGSNLTDHVASLSLGDGAVAILIGPQSKEQKCIYLRAGIRENYSEFHQLCTLKSFLGPMITNPSRLFSSALSKFVPLCISVLEAIEWGREKVDHIITHQASLPAIKKGAQLLGIPLAKWSITFPQYGNIATVSLPLTLSLTLAQQTEWLTKKILTIGFGSGIGVGVFALETYS